MPERQDATSLPACCFASLLLFLSAAACGSNALQRLNAVATHSKLPAATAVATTTSPESRKATARCAALGVALMLLYGCEPSGNGCTIPAAAAHQR